MTRWMGRFAEHLSLSPSYQSVWSLEGSRLWSPGPGALSLCLQMGRRSRTLALELGLPLAVSLSLLLLAALFPSPVHQHTARMLSVALQVGETGICQVPRRWIPDQNPGDRCHETLIP